MTGRGSQQADDGGGGGESSSALPASFFDDLQAEEAAVLRECLYSLQGIDGDRIRFLRRSDHCSDDGTGGGNASYTKGQNSKKHQQLLLLREEEEGTYVQSPAVLYPLLPSYVRKSLLGAGAVDGLRACGEAGWLYSRIRSYIADSSGHAVAAAAAAGPTSSSSASSTRWRRQDTTKKGTGDAGGRGGGGGAVARALAGAMEKELQSYRSFLAQLEHRPPSNLRQVLIDIQPCLPRLKTLAMLADGLREGNGGGGAWILNELHRHSRSGDTRHARLVRELWRAASTPWLQMLCAWITQGALVPSDVDEFFVVAAAASENSASSPPPPPSRHQNPDRPHDLDDDKHLWRHRFRLDHSKVPTGNIDPSLVGPAFLVGKGINYIHRCLLDGGWSLEQAVEEDVAAGGSSIAVDFESMINRSCRCLSDADGMPDLREPIETAARLVHSHILRSLRDEHMLMTHLFALKQFMLLGQGDFFSSLMDGIHAEYEGRQGIVGIYKHSLMSIVETAVRNTNACGFPPPILERLEVELLLEKGDDASFTFGETKESAKDERTVWDIFCLKYTVPDPLVAILPDSTMALYKKMFLFLFGLRKVSFSLTYTWRQSAVLQHALQTSAQWNAVSVRTSPNYAQANVLLRKIAITRQSMIHFVTNLTTYLMLEVLEGGWKELTKRIDDARTLDEVIQAHDDYLNGICQKSLLPKSDGPRTIATSGEEEDLGEQVQDLLMVASEFCNYQEELFSKALQEAEKAAEKRRHAEERLTLGDWGFQSGIEEPDEEDTFFGLADTSKLDDLDMISDMFQELVVDLLKGLDQKLHGVPIKTQRDAAANTPVLSPNAASTSSSTPWSHKEEQYDLDSLRFLAFQLDHNNFYGDQGKNMSYSIR